MNKPKRIVITGASAGIGADCARAFAAQGHDVALGARRLKKLESLKKEIESNNGSSKIFIHPLDQCDKESVQTFYEQCIEKFGIPDVIINNAGMASGVDHVINGQEEDWQKMINTNVLGLLRFTKTFLPKMIENNDWSQVINISSIAGHFSYAGGSVYAATKHSVKAISQALRIELMGKQVRVNMISPGLVETEFSNVRLGDDQKAKEVYKGMSPLVGKDIADCATFICDLPNHVNIDDMIVMPTDQASVFHVNRTN